MKTHSSWALTIFSPGMWSYMRNWIMLNVFSRAWMLYECVFLFRPLISLSFFQVTQNKGKLPKLQLRKFTFSEMLCVVCRKWYARDIFSIIASWSTKHVEKPFQRHDLNTLRMIISLISKWFADWKLGWRSEQVEPGRLSWASLRGNCVVKNVVVVAANKISTYKNFLNCGNFPISK